VIQPVMRLFPVCSRLVTYFFWIIVTVKG
jgi:hypothetical protein